MPPATRPPTSNTLARLARRGVDRARNLVDAPIVIDTPEGGYLGGCAATPEQIDQVLSALREQRNTRRTA